MMTILEIVQSALDELGLPYPAGIISTTDPTERQCNALLTAAGRYFRSQRTFVQLKKKHSFATVALRYQYPLPADFFAALPNTQWDETTKLKLLGPTDDATFARNQIMGTGGTTAYRIFGPDLNPASTAGQFMVDPVPSGVVTLSFEYIIRSMFVKSDYTTFYETVNASGDFCLFDDDLMVAEFKWRYLRSKKKDYAQEKQDAKDLLDSAVARWHGSHVGSMTGGAPQKRYEPPTPGGWTF